MAPRNVAVVKNGVVENVIVVDDDPASAPGIVRATGTFGGAFVEHLASDAKVDACVELHEGEACGPGDRAAIVAIKGEVVRAVDRDVRVKAFTSADAVAVDVAAEEVVKR